MLVLRRNAGESIVIAGVITISILAIEGPNRVKIGIEAPPDVTVTRKELLTDNPSNKTAAIVEAWLEGSKA